MAIKLTEAEERAIKSKAQEKVNSMTADEVSKKAKSQRITTIISSIATIRRIKSIIVGRFNYRRRF